MAQSGLLLTEVQWRKIAPLLPKPRKHRNGGRPSARNATASVIGVVPRSKLIFARSLRVQSQQLPTESHVFEDEIRPAIERTDQPAGEMLERRDHGKNSSGKDGIKLRAKSFISQVHHHLTRHRREIRETQSANPAHVAALRYGVSSREARPVCASNGKVLCSLRFSRSIKNLSTFSPKLLRTEIPPNSLFPSRFQRNLLKCQFGVFETQIVELVGDRGLSVGQYGGLTFIRFCFGCHS
jgi:hypothetical protein